MGADVDPWIGMLGRCRGGLVGWMMRMLGHGFLLEVVLGFWYTRLGVFLFLDVFLFASRSIRPGRVIPAGDIRGEVVGFGYLDGHTWATIFG